MAESNQRIYSTTEIADSKRAGLADGYRRELEALHLWMLASVWRQVNPRLIGSAIREKSLQKSNLNINGLPCHQLKMLLHQLKRRQLDGSLGYILVCFRKKILLQALGKNANESKSGTLSKATPYNANERLLEVIIR